MSAIKSLKVSGSHELQASERSFAFDTAALRNQLEGIRVAFAAQVETANGGELMLQTEIREKLNNNN